MNLTKKAKVTSRINHDSLWVKIKNEDGKWAKLLVSRAGATVSHTQGVDKDFCDDMYAIFSAAYKLEGGTKGTALEALVKHLKEIVSNA